VGTGRRELRWHDLLGCKLTFGKYSHPQDWSGSDQAALTALYAWLQADEQGRDALHQLLTHPATGAGALIERLNEAKRNPETSQQIVNYLTGGRVDKLVQIAKNYGPVILQFTSPADQLQESESINQLPRDIPDFTGRSDEIVQVLQVLGEAETIEDSSPVILSISGAPGVGKSTLAVHVAHRLITRFPDAQLYARLQDDKGRQLDPHDILADLLVTFDVDRIPASIEMRGSKYRSLLAKKRILVLLDNARDEEQIRPLLPGSPSCAVLITSRSELTTLEGASHLPLKVMGEDDALELLQQIAGDGRLSNYPRVAKDIVRFCDYLPLAVRIAGAKLRLNRRRSPSELAALLVDERTRLDRLEEGHFAIRASFGLSYAELRALHPDQARTFRLLGLMSGPTVVPGVVGALMQCDDARAEELLELLVEAQLLERIGDDEYGFHDLMRLFSRKCLEEEENEEEKRAALSRALSWYLEAAPAAALTEFSSRGRESARRASWVEAVDTYSAGLRVAAQLVRTDQGSRRSWLPEAMRMAGLTAYAQSKAGNLQGAALAFEQGQVINLSSDLGSYQKDLKRLRELGRNDLLASYLQVEHELQTIGQAVSTQVQSLAPEEEAYRDIRSISNKLDEIVSEVRALPGFESFLASPTFEEVAIAAKTQPVAYVAATEFGGLALLLGPELGPSVVFLPELTEEELFRQSLDYFRAQRQLGTEAHGDWRIVLDRVTQWLWDALMEPVFEQLLPKRRITIVPSGLLQAMPLHAAWAADASAPTGRRYALDEGVVTYGPSCRSLLASQRLAENTRPDSFLAIVDPRPTTLQPLLWSPVEVQAAAATFSRGNVNILSHASATRDAVLSSLPFSSVLHLACYGFANVDNPLDSFWIMAADERLTLREMLDLGLRSRLAVLRGGITVSFAESKEGVGSETTFNLATALLQGGVAGVVACYWPSRDDVMTILIAYFYYLWRVLGMDPSAALIRAQQWTRDTTNAEKVEIFSSGAWLPSSAAESLVDMLILEEPGERSFSHPTDWGGFAFLGA
jgi:CHAT domain-containing protein